MTVSRSACVNSRIPSADFCFEHLERTISGAPLTYRSCLDRSAELPCVAIIFVSVVKVH